MTMLPHAQMKTLIAAFALVALVLSAGNADAYVNKSRIHEAYGYVDKSRIRTTTVGHEQAAPLSVHDCVHVAFPQCSDNEVR
jgi:hypothetical protein